MVQRFGKIAFEKLHHTTRIRVGDAFLHCFWSAAAVRSAAVPGRSKIQLVRGEKVQHACRQNIAAAEDGHAPNRRRTPYLCKFGFLERYPKDVWIGFIGI